MDELLKNSAFGQWLLSEQLANEKRMDRVVVFPSFWTHGYVMPGLVWFGEVPA